MKIKIFGCRGSLPTPDPAMMRYGGNTTCIEIRSTDGDVVIFDAGSGLCNLGKELCAENSVRNVRFFFTHAHWDHLLGFPFFKPAYRNDFTLNFCSGKHAQSTIREYLSHQMQAPYFPVDLEALNATMVFMCDNPHNEDRYCCCGDLEVKAFPVNHSNGGFGYKVVENGKTLVFAPDNELGFLHPDGPDRNEFVNLFRDVDLLIHDAQYTDEDYKLTRGWGHSTFAATTDLAIESGVKRLGLFHHDPERCDDDLDRQVELCRERIYAAGSDIDCFAVVEGMEISL